MEGIKINQYTYSEELSISDNEKQLENDKKKNHYKFVIKYF